MDLREELLKRHSKNHTVWLAKAIGHDKKKFGKLMEMVFSNEEFISQRAAWVMSYCAEAHPELIEPYLQSMILNLGNRVHVAVKRNTVRILQFIQIPNEFLGIAADCCFRLLASPEETIAVKAFSMTVLYNICRKEPGLGNELVLVLEDQMPQASAGFRARARKILKALKAKT